MSFITNHWFLWIMLGIATVFVFVWLFVFNKKRLQIGLAESIILSLIHVVYGVLTVVFFGFAEAGFDTKALGNISMFGGIFFMPIMYVLFAIIRKKDIKVVFDVFTPALVATLLLARVNCLHDGCCYGIIIGGTDFRVPTREIEIFYDCIFLILVVPLIMKDKYRGYFYPIYLISYGIMRFTTEWFRYADTTSPLHNGHIWSIVVVVAGSLILGYLIYKNKKVRLVNEK